jgi:5-methylcytosine-specific restriction endonuclease McrA
VKARESCRIANKSPEQIERKREWNRRYEATHRQDAAARSRKWREAHPEQVRAERKARLVANPEQNLLHGRLYRARKAGVESDGHSRLEVFERDGGVCQMCGVVLDPENWHQDHIIPISAGGPDTLDNVQASCPPCNHRKGSRVGL